MAQSWLADRLLPRPFQQARPKMAAAHGFEIIELPDADRAQPGQLLPIFVPQPPPVCPAFRPGRLLVWRYKNLTLGLDATLWLDEFNHQISFQSKWHTTDWHGYWHRSDNGLRLCPPHLVTT